MALSADFIYFAARLARLARQWMKERGLIVCTLIVGFIYLVARLARLARQWIERGMFGSFGSAVDERTRNDCMHVNCWVHIKGTHRLFSVNYLFG